jgi:hypothetical protein
MKAINITIRKSMCRLPLIQNLQAQTLPAAYPQVSVDPDKASARLMAVTVGSLILYMPALSDYGMEKPIKLHDAHASRSPFSLMPAAGVGVIYFSLGKTSGRTPARDQMSIKIVAYAAAPPTNHANRVLSSARTSA